MLSRSTRGRGEGEGKEGSMSGQREQLNGDAVSLQGLADPVESFEAGMNLQRCSELEQEDEATMLSICKSQLPRKGTLPWVGQLRQSLWGLTAGDSVSSTPSG